MRLNRIKIFISFIILLSIISFGCASTKNIRENTWKYLEENHESVHLYPYPNDTTSVSAPFSEKYLFLRLYNPHAKYNIGTVILQKGLEFTERHAVSGSHIAIGFDLTDSFYGLTLYAKPNLKIEQCTDTSTNEFMKSCDPEKSLQTTFAIPVSKEEYELAAEWMKHKFETQSANYSISDNFKMAGVALKRKSKPDAKKAKHPQSQEEEFQEFEEMNKFVCSTFVCHVLFSSVDSIRNYMNENLIDPNYAMPTDIVTMPGVHKLFTSSWQDYNTAAGQFVMHNPEFAEYVR
ncbi:hypothetical protein [uncultured Treponema sp.]|uniref:hypothetical protein n=1 Tax=uncultured Treponema sp. TaxID=162155 RepID=UPI0025915F69|nr:hypothetical protein [uncultured Treponema sp.]